jgi:acetyl esterase/lipase
MFGTKSWLPPAQLTRYLQAGYVVVSIGHWLGPESKLPEIAQDLEDAYAWICAQGPTLLRIDPTRIAIVGHSSGGYLALLGGVLLLRRREQPRPKALVSLYVFGNLTGDWTVLPNASFNPWPLIAREEALTTVGTTKEIACGGLQYSDEARPKFFHYCKRQGCWTHEATGLDPRKATDRTALTQWEPLAHLSADFPPTLLIHGEQDKDVPVAQSILVADELQKLQVTHILGTNPAWEHLFDLTLAGDAEVQAVLDQMVAFLQTHV